MGFVRRLLHLLELYILSLLLTLPALLQTCVGLTLRLLCLLLRFNFGEPCIFKLFGLQFDLFLYSRFLRLITPTRFTTTSFIVYLLF